MVYTESEGSTQMNIFHKLKLEQTFTNNELVVVQFLLHQPEVFLKLTSKEICQTCFVSSSTIYRLCQKIKVTGIGELKQQLSSALPEYLHSGVELNYDYPFSNQESQYQVSLKIKELYQQTINDSFDLMDLDEIQNVVHACKQAKEIDIYTSAGNIFFADNFRFQMQEIGVKVNVPKEEYEMHLAAGNANEDHIAFIISYSGKSRILYDIFTVLKHKEIHTVLISSTQAHPLASKVKHHLFLSSFENHYNKISSFSSRLSLLYLLDCLYAQYFNMDYEHHRMTKLKMYQAMSKR